MGFVQVVPLLCPTETLATQDKMISLHYDLNLASNHFKCCQYFTFNACFFAGET